MINRVEFRNFKALRDVSVDLERFTVLVGPNASGKTSVLEGLYLLLKALSERPENIAKCIPVRYRALRVEGNAPVTLVCVRDHETICVNVAPDVASVDVESAGLHSIDSFPQRPSHYGSAIPSTTSVGEVFNLQRGSCILLRLDTGVLAAPSYSDEAIPTMGLNGRGLASVLSYLLSGRPDEFERIVGAVRAIIPSFHGVRFPRARVLRTESEIISVGKETVPFNREREYWGNSMVLDMENARGVPAEMASDGTLLLLGLVTLLMGPNRPQLVLLDDVDRGLHPKAQEQVVQLLRRLLEENADLQIVATSHSPYLLHHLRPEEVRLTVLSAEGQVVVGRLDEHPEFEKWKDEMTPGELWSLFGENWLTEAKAAERV